MISNRIPRHSSGRLANPARKGFKSIYAMMRVYPVQFFAEDERSGFNWGFNISQWETIKRCPGLQSFFPGSNEKQD